MKNNLIQKQMVVFMTIPLMLFSLAGATHAESSAASSARSERIQQKQENRNELRKEHAIKEIERRMSRLEGLKARITNMRRLTDSQKTALIGQIQAEITNLNTLKTTIEAETDPAKLKEEKRSIVTSYRIYVLFIPKIHIMAYADKILALADEMSSLTDDPAVLAKINDARTQAQAAIDTVYPLTPEEYPGNKTKLQAARDMNKNAHKYLKEARKLMTPQSDSSSSQM